MTKTLVLTMACLMMGCRSLPTPDTSSDESSSLAHAQKLYEEGDLYAAKRLTREFLESHPDDAQGTQLMGLILDEETSQYKEAFETQTPEELAEDEKNDAIKTGMERGRSLLEIGEFDEAARAVESVFQYDAQHRGASALMDEIKNEAMKQGKRESSDYSEIVHSEVEGRSFRYKQQARTWIEAGKWGGARLAVEKALMLNPEDEEALDLLKQIKAQRQD